MHLTKKQIELFINKVGQPKASVLLNKFFNSYREHLDSNDVKELYDDEYLNIIRQHPIHRSIDGKYKIHAYNRYSYEYILSKQVGSVLDIGCGSGDFILALAFHGFKGVGVDFSENFTKEARHKAREGNLEVDFFCTDVSNLSEIKQFDYVVMNDVTEHLSDRELDKIFTKIKTLLHSDSEIIIHTPNGLALCNDTDHSLLQVLYKKYLRLFRGFKGFERTVIQMYYDQLHVNIKSYRGLKRVLSRYGFESKVIYDADSYSLLRSVLSPNMLVIARRG